MLGLIVTQIMMVAAMSVPSTIPGRIPAIRRAPIEVWVATP
jgi:hypothetical protein